ERTGSPKLPRPLVVSACPMLYSMAEKNVAVNRKASHDYEILRRLEAGVALTGSEIKSIRGGKISLQEAYVRPEHGDLWLLGAHIAPYEAASYLGHEPRR